MNKLKNIEELKEIIKGKNTVFCNGCFDLLHAGHIAFLTEAKKQGDILIVGLNSDKNVKSSKGQNRPINNEQDRATVLSALEVVDYVIIFDEDTPINLIKELKPNVFVNGEDYGEDCVEAPTVKSYGGKIHIVKDFEGLSTTKFIENILDAYER
jgi:D-glycero-beta-D-manno-heptose 1-phosphate adenylyltransferase